jgi:hypothetical protein
MAAAAAAAAATGDNVDRVASRWLLVRPLLREPGLLQLGLALPAMPLLERGCS